MIESRTFMDSQTFIFLKDIHFHSPVGVLQQEKEVGNDISIDIRVGFPFAKALETDDIADTLNYATVYNILKEESEKSANLLERLGGRIGERLQKNFPGITSIDMRITKLNPPIGADCDGAGVEIHLINTKTEV